MIGRQVNKSPAVINGYDMVHLIRRMTSIVVCLAHNPTPVRKPRVNDQQQELLLRSQSMKPTFGYTVLSVCHSFGVFNCKEILLVARKIQGSRSCITQFSDHWL